MHSNVTTKVQQAIKLFDEFDLYSQEDQIDLMAAVTFLRLKDPQHAVGLTMMGASLYRVYFNARLAKLSIKPHDTSEYAQCLRASFAQQDINKADQTLKALLSPSKSTWSQMLGSPSLFYRQPRS